MKDSVNRMQVVGVERSEDSVCLGRRYHAHGQPVTLENMGDGGN